MHEADAFNITISKLVHRETKFFTESTCDINLVIFPQTAWKCIWWLSHEHAYRQKVRNSQKLKVSL